MSHYSGPMTRSRTRKRLEAMKKQSIHGDGEIVTNIINTRWKDLDNTLRRNNWPHEFRETLIDIYRYDIKANGFRIKNAAWKKQVLPFAARNCFIPADWAEIVKSVLGADLKLEGLTKETMEWLRDLQETSKTNPPHIAAPILHRRDSFMQVMIFKIYMLQFVQVLRSNIEVSTAYKIARGAKKVELYASIALAGTVFLALLPLIAVVKVLSLNVDVPGSTTDVR